MMVLSRQRDQSVMIGDDIEVTVLEVRGDHAAISVMAPGLPGAPPQAPANQRMRDLGLDPGPGRSRAQYIMQRDEAIEIRPGISISVVDIREDKVRLGVMAPQEVSVHRKEVWDALRRENIAATRTPQTTERLSELAGVTIRDATVDDLPAINAIYNHYVMTSTATYQTEPSTEAERLEWFNEHGPAHPITVATRLGEVVGWGSLSRFHKRSAYGRTVENSMYIRDDQRRKGVGQAILADLIDRAAALGYHSIIGLIDAEQTASIALHEKFGFQRVGHLKQVGFKFGRWLDVLYLQRTL